MTSKSRLGLRATGVSLGLVLAVSAARPFAVALASDAQVPRALEKNCDFLVPQIDQPAGQVRPFVPLHFTLDENALGMAPVQVGAVECEKLTIYGREHRRVRWVFLRVGIRHPDNDPSEPINGYTIWIASDNLDFVKFFREQGKLPNENAVHVSNLVFNYYSATKRVEIVAPPPTPAPFKMTAKVIGDRTEVVPVLIANYWSIARGGRMKEVSTIRGIELAPTEIGTGTLTIDDPNSDMAAIFCDSDNLVEFNDSYGSFQDGEFTVEFQEVEDIRPPSRQPACPDFEG